MSVYLFRFPFRFLLGPEHFLDFSAMRVKSTLHLKSLS